jgi:CelD/BcsL family acetyltransferase involved in cellulose biosynthesis
MSIEVPHAIQCRILTHFAELENLAGDWDRLWAGNPRREIFDKFAWIRAWWRSYGQCVSLCTPVAIADGELVGILPLVREKNWLRFLGHPGSDYNDVLCHESQPAEILEALLDCLWDLPRDSWKGAVLDNVPGHSRLAS